MGGWQRMKATSPGSQSGQLATPSPPAEQLGKPCCFRQHLLRHKLSRGKLCSSSLTLDPWRTLQKATRRRAPGTLRQQRCWAARSNNPVSCCFPRVMDAGGGGAAGSHKIAGDQMTAAADQRGNQRRHPVEFHGFQRWLWRQHGGSRRWWHRHLGGSRRNP